MIDDDRISDLKRLYSLFGRPGVTEGLNVLKAALKRTIHTRGTAVNMAVLNTNSDKGPDVGTGSTTSDKAKAPSSKTQLSGSALVIAALHWVQEVVDLKDKADRILSEAFSDDKSIQMSMNEVSQS